MILATHQMGTKNDATDMFCGIGGSSSGLVRAGWDVRLAANHNQTAVATHAANHPSTEHLCADIQSIDLRYLPTTRMLWASPICTELSPSGGLQKKAQRSMWEEHGYVSPEAYVRTRVTFWEVLRAAEVHRYEVIILENVVESFDWNLMPVFLAGLETLGYEIQIVAVSAAHVGGENNPNAPQLRDRVYWLARRRGLKAFDVDPHPACWCDTCGVVTGERRWGRETSRSRGWKGQRVGKYGAQYVWVCPAGHGRVEPLIMPAAAAIDWSDLGTRIGDRKRKLAATTRRRIALGLEMISNPVLVAAAGNTYDQASGSSNRYLRATDPMSWPTPTQTTSAQTALAVHEPFVTMLRNHGKAVRVGEPLPTFAASGHHHGLTVPPRAFVSKYHGGYAEGSTGLNRPVTLPAPTMRANGQHSLVVPYRRGSRPHSPNQALSTVATREQHGLMSGAADIDVDDCYFRMLTPREAANAQRFEPDYKLLGTLGEQQMGAGNAVPVNVAQWLGTLVAEALDAA